jgi:hypothetical protein
MPNPFTHVILNIAIFYPFRKILGKYWILAAAIAGLLPDTDFVFEWVFNSTLFGHGGFFHSIGFILILLGISLIMYNFYKEFGKYGFIITIGSGLHILIDLIIGGGGYSLMVLYPFTTEAFRIHLLEPFLTYGAFEILDAFLIFFVAIWYFFKLKSD